MGHLLNRLDVYGRYAGFCLLISLMVFLAGCAGQSAVVEAEQDFATQYRVGPGDVLDVFVWRNPDLSVAGVPVRPDGGLSIPLVEDVSASGKTPTELARDISGVLAAYIKDPLVTVTVKAFSGVYSDQVRVIGQATLPAALPYRNGMRLLDLIIAVGGLTEYAAGDKAFVLRGSADQRRKLAVKLDSLIYSGDLSLNILLQPGDVLVIPEAWF